MNKPAIIFIAVAIAALSALAWFFKPQSPPSESPAVVVVEHQQKSEPAVSQLPEERIFEWQVAQSKRVYGPEVIQVRQREKVTLKITTDHDDELHLHGYDLQLKLKAGEKATLSFEASHSGRFEFELHHAHLELGVLEVLPE